MRNCLVYLIAIAIWSPVCHAQPAFTVIPLGVKGGNDESNLSAYAVTVSGTDAYVCLDAGTLYFGIQRAIASQLFEGTVLDVLRNKIKGYLISHPHVDHLAGLILNSPDDSAKPIYGLPFCLEAIQENYFNWKSWPNFGNQGTKPLLNKYQYVAVSTEHEIPLAQTTMSARAFTLSHAMPYQSTAFLIRHAESYLLYLGDTGADAVEQSDHLKRLWQAISPLIAAGKLKAMLVEVSFPNARPDQLLFGHLTPRLLMNEMKILSQLAGGLQGFPLVVTHIKPPTRPEEILRELEELNELGLRIILAEQAEALEF